MIKNKFKILVGVIASLLFITNVNANCKVSVGSAFDTGYGYSTQKQTCTTSSGKTIDIYCIDKGYHNVGDLSQCSFKEVTGTGFTAIYSMYSGFASRELAYRYFAYITGVAKTPVGNVAPKIKNGSIVPNDMKDAISKLSPSLSTNTQRFSETHKVNGTTATVTITVDVANLTAKNFSVTNGARITNVVNSGDKTIVTVVQQIVTCEGAKFNLNLLDVYVADTNRLFIATCPGVQGYVVEIPVGVSVGEIIGSGNPNGGDITDTFEVTVPDPNCACSGSTNLQGACEPGQNGKKYYVKDSEDIKTCIISGAYQDYCGNSIQKTNDNNGSADRTSVYGKQTDANSGLASRKYCEVYCTEDIEYDFPGVINAGTGQYFKLLNDETNQPLKITGKRTCYTTEIKRSNYISDVQKYQQSIVDNYNLYLYYKNMAESAGSASIHSHSVGGCSTGGGSTSITSYDGNRINFMAYSISFDGRGSANLRQNISRHAEADWSDTQSCGACPGDPKKVKGSYCTKTETSKPAEMQQLYATQAEGYLNAAKQELENLKVAVNNYKSCYEWNNNYCFNPKVEFSYDEVYDMTGELSSTISNGATEEKFITGSIDNNYNGQASSTYNRETVNYLNINGTELGIQTSEINVTASYVSKSVTKTATYNTSTKNVYSYHPYGTISFDKNCGAPANKAGNCINLGYVLPIALEHQNSRQSYNYYLNISNIGSGGNDAQCDLNNIGNRIMGNGCSLYNSETEGNVGDTEYTCQYKTCPDCDVECVCPPDRPDCFEEDKECHYVTCPTCTVTCVGCLWNDGDTTFGYKQVSVSDVFPNSKDHQDVGYNWNTNPNINPQAEKAKDTIEEIEKESNKVYEDIQYSYILAPSTMGKIREYNKKADGKIKSNVPLGGFNNDTLYSSKKGEEFKSSFLDEPFMVAAEQVRNGQWTKYKNGSAWK